MDVVLLGLPHKVSAHKVPEIMKTGARIVDLSGDFRLRDAAAYKKYYGAEHPSAQLLDGTFVYGLPELNREQISARKYVASPGCFATTIELALLPLAQGRRCSTATSRSSASPARRAPAWCRRATTHHPTRAVNLRTYKPLEHQHIPEITETLHAGGRARRCCCASCRCRRRCRAASSPPASRTSTARSTKDAVAAAFAETFRGEPFVRVPQEAPARGRRGQRLELRRGRLRRRRRARSGHRQARSSPASRSPTT